MRPDHTTATPEFVTDTNLAAGTRWDATVIATGPTGTELARQRFVFAFDGRRSPRVVRRHRSTPAWRRRSCS